MRLPFAKFADILGHSLREENVPGVAAIHHSLGKINSGAGDVGPLIILYGGNRAAVDAHSHR